MIKLNINNNKKTCNLSIAKCTSDVLLLLCLNFKVQSDKKT